MVILTVKRGDEARFLFETTVSANVGALTQQLASIHNAQQRIDRLAMGKLEELGGMWVVEKIRWTCFVYASPSLCFLCSNSQSHTRTHTHTSDILDISYNNHFLYSFHFHCLSHARTC